MKFPMIIWIAGLLLLKPNIWNRTVLKAFAESLPQDEYVVIYLSDTKLSPRCFYKGMPSSMFRNMKCWEDLKSDMDRISFRWL